MWDQRTYGRRGVGGRTELLCWWAITSCLTGSCAVSGGAWWRSWPCLHAASESNPHGTVVQIDARGAVVRAATYGELLEDDQWW